MAPKPEILYSRNPISHPLQTYREYSEVHLKTAEMVAGLVLEQKPFIHHLRILDAGAGDGSFTTVWLAKLLELRAKCWGGFDIPAMTLDLLEPEPVAVKGLKKIKRILPEQIITQVIQGKLEEFTPTELYDVIFFLHTAYFFSNKKLPIILEKAISLLKPGGCMIIEARTRGDRDDQFTNRFLSKLNDVASPQITIESVLVAVKFILSHDAMGLRVVYSEHESSLRLPQFAPNDTELLNIIRFFLQVGSERDIPQRLQQKIIAYINKHRADWTEREGDVLIWKLKKKSKKHYARTS